MERDPRGLGGAWADHQRHGSADPPPDLAPWVERIWSVTWSYDRPYRQQLLPHLGVHLTFPSDAEPTVAGPATRARHRVLDGAGGVVGAAFRPGVFGAVLGRPLATLVDTSVPAATLFGPLPAAPDVASVAALLRRALPPAGPSPAAEEAVALVARITAPDGPRRVDDLAAAAGTTVRRLQRLFAGHVGVGPKAAIRQARLREVTARLDAGERVDWAAVAADLGYADQAHLSRDVAALLGEPPTAFAARY